MLFYFLIAFEEKGTYGNIFLATVFLGTTLINTEGIALKEQIYVLYAFMLVYAMKKKKERFLLISLMLALFSFLAGELAGFVFVAFLLVFGGIDYSKVKDRRLFFDKIIDFSNEIFMKLQITFVLLLFVYLLLDATLPTYTFVVLLTSMLAWSYLFIKTSVERYYVSYVSLGSFLGALLLIGLGGRF